jgi:hypothetical protein
MAAEHFRPSICRPDRTLCIRESNIGKGTAHYVDNITAEIALVLKELTSSNAPPPHRATAHAANRAKSGLEKFSLLRNWLFFCVYL